jgi:hypothetical protein
MTNSVVAIINPEEIENAIWRVDKHERWTAIGEVHNRLPDAKFYNVFVSLWANSESNDLFIPLIDKLVVERNIIAVNVMPNLSENDQEFYNNLPNSFTIWRGMTLEDAWCDYSWTTDQERAIWFAKRCDGGTPGLATALVFKDDILFATQARHESEIAVKTNCVTVMEIKRIEKKKSDPNFALYSSIQRGAFDMWQNPERFKTHLTYHALREPLEVIKENYYSEVEWLERCGLITTPTLRRKVLDELNWDYIQYEAERFREIMATKVSKIL